MILVKTASNPAVYITNGIHRRQVADAVEAQALIALGLVPTAVQVVSVDVLSALRQVLPDQQAQQK